MSVVAVCKIKIIFDAFLLGGTSAFHFPLHWEQAAWLRPGQWQESQLEVALVETWREMHDNSHDILKYKLGSEREPLETRRIPGELGLVAQKALGRAGKRKPPKEILHIVGRRDAAAFHFGSARRAEVVLAFDAPPVLDVWPPYSASSALLEGNISGQGVPGSHNHAVLVNVSPFCAFHFVLATDLAELLPQVLTQRSLQIACEFIRHFSQYLKLTFNSLGAGASVNHLHWQGMYIQEPLPIEMRSRQEVGRLNGIRIEDVEWPLKTWAFSGEVDVSAEHFASTVFPFIQQLLDGNLAHNLCFSRVGGVLRLFVIPRRIFNFPDPTRAQVASTEAFGYWIMPNLAEYGSLTEADAIERMTSVAAWGENSSAAVRDVLQKIGWELPYALGNSKASYQNFFSKTAIVMLAVAALVLTKRLWSRLLWPLWRSCKPYLSPSGKL